MINILNTLKESRKKGFTLIEMIVVIVIIAILAAIAIPAMQGYIQDAKEAVAISNCRTALTASESLASNCGDENGDGVINQEDFAYGLSEILGTEIMVNGDPWENYYYKGEWNDGTLYVGIYDYNSTVSTASGTFEVCWESEDGIIALWWEGMAAPEIDKNGDYKPDTAS